MEIAKLLLGNCILLFMREIIIIAHDIRSTHNVGSLLRTAEGLGVQTVYFTGYTPYPLHDGDQRLPHLAQKVHKQIQKTALGAETLVDWHYNEDVTAVIKELKATDYHMVALEQSPDSVKLPDFQPPEKMTILLGREVEGLSPELLALCAATIEIPMFGQKESFNVVQAAAMAVYHCRFY
jgi:23S rRNA (guanosine2251-2'-O)-methyltransferase